MLSDKIKISHKLWTEYVDGNLEWNESKPNLVRLGIEKKANMCEFAQSFSWRLWYWKCKGNRFSWSHTLIIVLYMIKFRCGLWFIRNVIILQIIMFRFFTENWWLVEFQWWFVNFTLECWLQILPLLLKQSSEMVILSTSNELSWMCYLKEFEKIKVSFCSICLSLMWIIFTVISLLTEAQWCD